MIAAAPNPRSLAWSPDGRWVQYWDLGAYKIRKGVHVARADGSGSQLVAHEVFPAGWLQAPVLPMVIEMRGKSPYSQRVSLFAVDPQSQRKQKLQLPFDLPACFGCSIAPSLTRAVVWRSGGFLLASAPGKTRQLWKVPHIDIESGPHWSPDENHLAFVRCDPQTAIETGIEIIDLDTASRRTLVAPRLLLGGAAWSPDGEEIAFSVSRRDAAAGVLGWAAGMCRRCVSGWTIWMYGASNALTRLSDKHIRSAAYSVRVRDGKVRELFRVPRGKIAGSFAWSPDGGQLAAVCWSMPTSSGAATIRVFEVPAAKPDDWAPAEEVLPGCPGGN